MSRWNLSKKSYIVSMLISMLLISVATIVPATMTNNISGLKTNLNPDINRNDSIQFQEFELLAEKLNIEPDFLREIIEYFQLYKINDKETKDQFLDRVRNLQQEIEFIYTNQKNINDISPDLYNLVSTFGKYFDNENFFKGTQDHHLSLGPDFEEYSITYENALNIWTGTLDGQKKWIFLPVIGSLITEESYYNWENKVLNIGDSVIAISTAFGSIFSLILAIIPIDSGAGILTNAICLFALIFLIYFDVSLIAYVNNGHEYMHRLCDQEIDIQLYITDEAGQGINDLYLSHGIEAYNVDAITWCDGTLGKTSNLFIYYIGPSEYMDKNGKDGWYTLRSHYIAEGYNIIQENYRKAPCPPGSWVITINGNNEYKGYEPIYLDIESGDTAIINPIVLESRK